MKPLSIKAPHGASLFEIQWPDGRTDRLNHSILRGYCPCAGCQGHSGNISFQENVNLDLREIHEVGNYALSLKWGDAHENGIYTFEFLRRLGDLLRQHGESGLIALKVITGSQ